MEHKYKYSELRKLGRGNLPADVNDHVKKMLAPLEKKIGNVFLLIDTARDKCWFSDKPGAVIIDTELGRAVTMIEFHCGIVKKFSMLNWFGGNYFPVNIKNDLVDFSKNRKLPEKKKPISNGVK